MRGKLKMRMVRDTTYQLWGWILFIICALSFIISSWKNKDTIALLGSIVFLVACIVFMIPLLRNDEPQENECSGNR